MRSYSIAILAHGHADDEHLLESIAQFRQQIPFASIYWYGDGLEDSKKIALQKLDVTIRHDESATAFKTIRRMFTEVDADVFVYLGNPDYPAELASSMIHTLVETRKDMVSAINPKLDGPLQNDYIKMCDGLFGRKLTCPLSDYRVFSRRFVKSFAAFERGFPIELEWSMHALELDIPCAELEIDADKHDGLRTPDIYTPTRGRHNLTRLIMNLQARPLKWFGLMTALFGVAFLFYEVSYILSFLEIANIIPNGWALAGAVCFAILAILTGISGILLHTQSHERRELKRLHFQQHSTL